MVKIEPSGTLSVNAKVLSKRQKGETVYNFAAGDPVLPNHSHITQAAQNFIQKEMSPYPPVEGIPLLRELAAKWVNATCKTQYRNEQVTATPGGKFAIYALLYTLLEPSEEVLFASPYWVSYPEITKIAGGMPKTVVTTAENSLKLTPEIFKAVSNKTKVLLFNNACNPSGVLYSRSELKALLEIAKEAGIWILSDEVYSSIVYEGEFVSCGAFPEHEEHVCVVQSCSKNFAMAGWRMGFAIAPEEITKKLRILLTQTTSGCASVTQWATVGALEHFEEVNHYVKSAMQKRRELFFSTFQELFSIGLEKPPSGIYAFVPLSIFGKKGKTDSIHFCERAIDEANVAIVPGLYFGCEGYVRFAYSDIEENITLGLRALAKWVHDT